MLHGLLAGLLLVASGCLDDVPEPVPEVTFTEALAFESLGRGVSARLDTTTAVTVGDAATWSAYQDSLRPLQPFKRVDFAQEMVLLVAEPVPTGGYDLRIEAVERAENSLTVYYLLITPGNDCRPTMGAAVPFQAVRLARSDAPLRVERVTDAYRCTEP